MQLPDGPLPLRCKPPNRYRLARWIAAVGMTSFLIGGGCCLYAFLTQQGWIVAFASPLMLLTGAPAIAMLLNLFAFPWTYSVFGTLKRTPFPEDKALSVELCSGVVLGDCRTGASYSLYRHGLGIEPFFFGRVFLPHRSIIAVEPGWFQVRLHHTWPEVRTPIEIPRRLYDRFALLCTELPKLP